MTIRELTKAMKSNVKEIFLYFILYFTLLIPYSLTLVDLDFFANQEITCIDSEFKVKEHKSQDSLFTESNSDVEETRLTNLFSFYIYGRENFFSIATVQNFFLLKKIPYKSLSIPPPQKIS